MSGGVQAGCPNCGHDLVTERIVTQPVGRKTIRLHWMICVACRHVALQEWRFLDAAGTRAAESLPRGTRRGS